VPESTGVGARLDKLKHIPRNQDADMSVGAADTSVRATSCAETELFQSRDRKGVGSVVECCLQDGTIC